MSALFRSFAAVLLFTVTAPAYYHFIRYTTRTAPYRALYEKFDLNVLPGRTLTYLVDDGAGVQLAPNDNYNALLSQIRAAARTWNDVETSELRLAFGGVIAGGSQSATPSLDILFEEVPPGVVAMGGPTIRADSNGLFVPILKAVVLIQPDLTRRPSYGEAFFATMVHEIGHAIGLQHTLTSSVMSQAPTRSISRARPLTTDDAAGISILYPRATFALTTGTLTGRVVTTTGSSVALASVVAIAPNGAAVSTLTHPDGTWRLEGLPARSYYLYVHPLPPPPLGRSTPADITYPLDSDGNSIGASQPFETVFYSGGNGGVKDPSQAVLIGVSGGSQLDGLNFTVRPRNGYGIHSVETFAFPGNTAVKPPYLSPGMERPFVIATGYGLTSGNGPVPGLAATVLGGLSLAVKPLVTAPASWIQMDFNPQSLLVSSDSARHVVFSTANDIYVLPSAFFHVGNPPPQIATVTAGAGSAVITAASVNQDTRIFFDGVQAPARGFEPLPGGAGRITVGVPWAPAGHRAVLTALNSDGQSSLFLQGDNPPAYVYPLDAVPTFAAATLAPATIAAGTEAMILIDAVNMQFTDGQVSVGFGTADVVARRVFVVSPTRLLVNVVAHASALPSVLNTTITSGLQILTQPFSFGVQAAPARPYWLSSAYVNAVTGQSLVSPGSSVIMLAGAAPVAMTTTNTVALIGETRVPLTAVNGNQVTFTIPPALQPGSVAIRLETATERSSPIAILIDPPGPRVLAASVTPLASGDIVTQAILVEVANISTRPGTVSFILAGKEARMLQMFPDVDRYRFIVEIPAETPRGVDVPLTITTDGRSSDPFSLKISG